jgi:hypothetical protein
MNLARARELIAALPISDAAREDILDCLVPTDRIHAQAYNLRLSEQEIRGADRDDAIRAAIVRFKSRVENVDGLRNAVRHPNERIRTLAKEMRDSESPNPTAKKILD